MINKTQEGEPVVAIPGEHIFANTSLSNLAVRWKELVEQEKHGEAMLVLEELIIGSTNMFERLAQHENFHYTVDLPTLVSAAQEKMTKWISRWNPKKGRLFSWLSKCAKNAFRSEIVKQNQYRKRYHVTGDDLEKFYGAEDHTVDKEDVAREVKEGIHGIHARWASPQELGALRFFVDSIIDEDHDKQKSIRSCMYAYGISYDLARFFYSWSLIELRDTFYARAYVGFTEQDLYRHAYSYTHLVELLKFIKWEDLKRIITVMGGTRLKLPTLDQLKRLRDDYRLFREVDASDQDPDSVGEIAKKHGKSARNAQDIYQEMSQKVDPARNGEYSIYRGDNDD